MSKFWSFKHDPLRRTLDMERQASILLGQGSHRCFLFSKIIEFTLACSSIELVFIRQSMKSSRQLPWKTLAPHTFRRVASDNNFIIGSHSVPKQLAIRILWYAENAWSARCLLFMKINIKCVMKILLCALWIRLVPIEIRGSNKIYICHFMQFVVMCILDILLAQI